MRGRNTNAVMWLLAIAIAVAGAGAGAGWAIVPEGLVDDGLSGTPTDNRAAIQAAMTSIGNRGTVEIPKGNYYVSASLETYGWVYLKGEGPHATALITNHATLPVIVVKPNPTVSDGDTYRMGKISDMSVYNTGQGPAIKADGVGFWWGHLENLHAGGGNSGPAIDLASVLAQDFVISKIWMHYSSLLGHSLIKIRGNGIGCIEHIKVNGSLRSDCANGVPLLDLELGAVSLRHLELEPTRAAGRHGYAIHIKSEGMGSAGIGWEDVHLEPHPDSGGENGQERRITNNINVIIDRGTVFGDHFKLLGAWGRLELTNKARVKFREFNIAGSPQWRLKHCLVLSDAASRFTADEVISNYDCGWLDHPQVTVRQNTYGTETALERTIENPPRTSGGNRVKYAVDWSDPVGQSGATVSTFEKVGHTLNFTTSAMPEGSRVFVQLPIGGVVDFVEWELVGAAGSQIVAYDQAGTELRTRAGGGEGLTRIYRPGASLTRIDMYIYAAPGGSPGNFTLRRVAAYKEE